MRAAAPRMPIARCGRLLSRAKQGVRAACHSAHTPAVGWYAWQAHPCCKAIGPFARHCHPLLINGPMPQPDRMLALMVGMVSRHPPAYQGRALSRDRQPAPAGPPGRADTPKAFPVHGVITPRPFKRRSLASALCPVEQALHLVPPLAPPADDGTAESNAFLTDPAVRGRVRASPRAFRAILFLDQNVLEVAPGPIARVIRAERPRRWPVVPSRHEVQKVPAELMGTYRLIDFLLYGSGPRLLECLRLRVQDLKGDQHQILVRHGQGGQGGQDRRTMRPKMIPEDLRKQRHPVKQRHPKDLAPGFGPMLLPFAPDHQAPRATTDWRW